MATGSMRRGKSRGKRTKGARYGSSAQKGARYGSSGASPGARGKGLKPINDAALRKNLK